MTQLRSQQVCNDLWAYDDEDVGSDLSSDRLPSQAPSESEVDETDNKRRRKPTAKSQPAAKKSKKGLPPLVAVAAPEPEVKPVSHAGDDSDDDIELVACISRPAARDAPAPTATAGAGKASNPAPSAKAAGGAKGKAVVKVDLTASTLSAMDK